MDIGPALELIALVAAFYSWYRDDGWLPSNGTILIFIGFLTLHTHNDVTTIGREMGLWE